MINSSDIDELHARIVLLKLREKTTEELISIWTDYDQNAYNSTEIDAVGKILLERVGKLPERPNLEDQNQSSKEMKEGIGYLSRSPTSYSDLSPLNEFRVALLKFWFFFICLGLVFGIPVELNEH